VGDKAPEFRAESINGGVVSTKLAAGSPMILRFFDPYCRYCKADTVVFNDYYQRYKGVGLRVVYIDTDKDVETIKGFVKDLKIEFPVVVDKDGALAELFTIKVIPQTIVLDPSHKIIGALIGGVGAPELDDLLGKFLRGS